MERRWVALLAGICLVFLGLAGWKAYPEWQLNQVESLYQAGDLHQARQKASSILKHQPEHIRVEVLLAEMLFQENQLTEAETLAAHALQRLQQARHDGDLSVKPWLGRVLYLKGLLRLRPAIYQVAPDDGIEWLALWTLPAEESFRAAVELDQSHPRWRAGKFLMTQISAEKAQKNAQDRRGMAEWQSFLKQEPLIQRLQSPEVAPDQPQVPASQLPVRQAIQNWQVIKREAFVEGKLERLREVLTGNALSESLTSAHWWLNHESAFYRDIQLHELRFLKVDYPSAESASVKVSIEETRDNSEEGLQRTRYQAQYQLQRVANDWLIAEIQVL